MERASDMPPMRLMGFLPTQVVSLPMDIIIFDLIYPNAPLLFSFFEKGHCFVTEASCRGWVPVPQCCGWKVKDGSLNFSSKVSSGKNKSGEF
jgi:hypothetical protein